jgi:hypothetical protein
MCADFNKAGDIFVKYLANRIRESGNGTGPDCELVWPDRPRKIFFIGRLAPGGEQEDEILSNAEDFLSRLDPISMQMHFLLRGGKDTRIAVSPRFTLFVRVFPDFSRQKRFSDPAIRAGRKASELMPMFRRMHLKIEPVEFRLGDIPGKAISFPVEYGRSAAAEIPGVYKGTANYAVRKEDLESEEVFTKFIADLRGEPAIPDIRVSLMLSSTMLNDGIWDVCVALVNRSPNPDPFGIARIYEEAIFDAGFDVNIKEGTVLPYEFPSLPKSYRFNRRMYGSGVNCTINCDSSVGGGPRVLSTEAMPTYEQRRFDHRDLAGIEPTFAECEGTGCVALLGRIAKAMRAYDETEWDRRGRDLQGNLPGGEEEYKEFLRDRELFQEETNRFERGIGCLEQPEVMRAFRLMNMTFRLMGAPIGRDRWRLFQIVFIVSLLPSVVGREYEKYASAEEWDFTDVIWFPTGGGKTEAYLGLTVFALFFDRLRGRERGVTALYRFPLRLLSLQQFQRIVKAIAAANRIRSEEKIPGEHFTVGHWIGSQGSPNEIKPEDLPQIEDDAKTKKYQKIFECPNPGCGSRDVHMEFNRDLWSLQHVCPSCGVLPIYIVDHELYRHLPSVVVGTVDKLAVFGSQLRFANLLGWTRAYCPTHGYVPEDKCGAHGCRTKIISKLPIKDPVPSLHVQDELHLLKEDLGAFDSHYETAIMEMQREVPGSKYPWKTIAATATIEEYERHVEHLYLRRGRRFPTPGPSYEQTFFAQTNPDLLSRLFIGVNPHGLTHINAMVQLLWYFHREISEIRKKSPGEFLDTAGLRGVLDEASVPSFLDQYEISLSYVLTKKSGDQMAESLDAQIGTYLKEKDLPELVGEVLSGGTTSEKITNVMDRIEKFDLLEPDYWKRIRSVVATSMISHGVDVERFNFIPFFGMPRMTSEYIQASSRVGRKLPGIVLVCFAPARERDRSHYHFFRKYHEYLERLVEPAAINRWSKFSIEKTFSGIIVGHIINSAARTLGRKLNTEKAIHASTPPLSEQGLTEKMITYYGAGRQRSGEFASIISGKVKMFFNGLRANGGWIGKRRGWAAMRSLRDTDQEVKFYPSSSGRNAELFELLLKDRLCGGEVDSGSTEGPADEQ